MKIIFCILIGYVLSNYQEKEIKFDWVDCQTRRSATLVGCGENPQKLIVCMEIPDAGLCVDHFENQQIDQTSFAAAFYTKGQSNVLFYNEDRMVAHSLINKDNQIMVGEIDDTHSFKFKIIASESSGEVYLLKFRFSEFDRNCLVFENPIICSNCDEGFTSYGGTCFSDQCNNDVEKLKSSAATSKIVDEGDLVTLRIKRTNIGISPCLQHKFYFVESFQNLQPILMIADDDPRAIIQTGSSILKIYINDAVLAKNLCQSEGDIYQCFIAYSITQGPNIVFQYVTLITIAGINTMKQVNSYGFKFPLTDNQCIQFQSVLNVPEIEEKDDKFVLQASIITKTIVLRDLQASVTKATLSNNETTIHLQQYRAEVLPDTNQLKLYFNLDKLNCSNITSFTLYEEIMLSYPGNDQAKSVHFVTNGTKLLSDTKVIHNHYEEQPAYDEEEEIQEKGNIVFLGIFLLVVLLLFWFRRAYLKHNAKLKDLGIPNTNQTQSQNLENENSLPDLEKQDAPTPVSENILSFTPAQYEQD